MDDELRAEAIHLADLALAGRRRRAPTAIVSLGRAANERTLLWEVAAMASVAIASVLAVIGAWFY